MNKLSISFKALSAITLLVSIVFIASSGVVAGTDSNNTEYIADNADISQSSSMGKCGAAEKSTSKASADKKEATGTTVEESKSTVCADCGKDGCTNCASHKAESMDADKKGSCGEGKCGGAEKSADSKDTKKEAKCGSGKCGG